MSRLVFCTSSSTCSSQRLKRVAEVGKSAFLEAALLLSFRVLTHPHPMRGWYFALFELSIKIYDVSQVWLGNEVEPTDVGTALRTVSMTWGTACDIEVRSIRPVSMLSFNMSCRLLRCTTRPPRFAVVAGLTSRRPNTAAGVTYSPPDMRMSPLDANNTPFPLGPESIGTSLYTHLLPG